MSGTWCLLDNEIRPAFHVYQGFVPLMPYNDKLNITSQEYCHKFVGGEAENSPAWHFEMRVAIDWVVRNRVRKYGMYEDNVGNWQNHIKTASTKLSSKFSLDAESLASSLTRELQTFNDTPKYFI